MAVPQPQDHEPKPSPRRRSRRWVIASTALAGITVVPTGLAWAFGPGGYLGENARRLRALEQDPMGAETILGHTAFHTDKAKLPGWLEVKYPGVYLRQYFYAHDLNTLKNEFTSYAEVHGWTKDPGISDSEAWPARHTDRKSDDHMILRIFISQQDRSITEGFDSALIVKLNYE